MFSSSVLRTQKSSSPLAAETSSRGLQQRIKKVEISKPDLVFLLLLPLCISGVAACGFFNYLSNYVRQLIVLIFLWKINVARLE